MEAPHNTRTYRAPWHDYSKPGCYMLTLNTYPRRAILGRPANDRIWLSEQGRVVARVWWALTKRYPEIICIFFCIMPDHLHWLLRIRKQLPHPLSFYMFRFMEETAKELGAVFVSPFISPGEKKVAEWVLTEKGRLIVLKDGGFPQLYKPSARYFDACAAGRCLVLSCYPWTGRQHAPGEFRPICLAMNAWVRQICQLPLG